MDDGKALKKYIMPGSWYWVATAVLAALTVLFLVFGFSETKGESAEDAVLFDSSQAGANQYAYIDIVGVSDWFYKVDDVCYYAALDADGYVYTVRLTDGQFEALGAYNDYWNDESADAVAPEPYRLYGLSKELDRDMAEDMSSSWDLSGADDYYSWFGNYMLDATTTPATETRDMWILFAVFTFLFGVVFGVMAAVPAKNGAKSLRRLEARGETGAAAAELDSPATVSAGGDTVRLGRSFLFGRSTGVALRYSDILWLYRHTTRYNFITVSETIIVCTGDKQKMNLCAVNGKKRNRNGDLAVQVFQAVAEHNPNALFGFSRQNAAEYKARVTAASGR